MMELYHLRYVIALAEKQNFSKAADELFITQPTLSQQIKKLEDNLGIQIFYRTTKTVTLTQDGKEFVDKARTVMKYYEELEAWTRQRSSGTGEA